MKYESVSRPLVRGAFIVGLVVWAVAAMPLRGGELRIERLFGPEVKTGPYKHPARIEELAERRPLCHLLRRRGRIRDEYRRVCLPRREGRKQMDRSHLHRA